MKTRIRRVRLRIRYKRRSDLVALVALVLLVPTFLGILAWGQKDASAAQASPAAFATMRKYYLTQSEVDGDEALTACASGYHMASLWEILDPSNLEYNTDLGVSFADSGGGPPADTSGWVRTGSSSATDVGVPGQDNCAAWTSDASTADRTTAYLPNDWLAGSEDMHVWDVGLYQCNLTGNVWCVEDYPSFTYTFLPLVLR